MLVCYLDESRTDASNPLVTVAGYAMGEEEWIAYERAVEPVFAARGVNILHAVDLQNTHDPFKGWSVLTKQAFTAQVCMPMKQHNQSEHTLHSRAVIDLIAEKPFPMSNRPLGIPGDIVVRLFVECKYFATPPTSA